MRSPLTEPESFRSEAAEAFAGHLARRAREILHRIPEERRAEVYALSLRIWRNDLDPRRPYLALGWVDENDYREELVRSPSADRNEVRWNYAYWPLDRAEGIGHVLEDPDGADLHRADLAALGSAPDAADDGEGCCERFAEQCVTLVGQLHSDGSIEETIGHGVPVIVFDMDEPGWEIEATLEANPVDLVRDFRDFFSPDS